MTAYSPRASMAMVGIACASYVAFSLPGIGWGLPSAQRSVLYEASYGEAVGSGEDRLFVTGPLQSYQVDECSTLMPLARMDPTHLQFNPKWFHWGTFHLYLLGAVLAGARAAGLVTLTTDHRFYLQHPEQLAAIYLTARAVSWVMGLAAVVLFAGLVRRVTSRPLLSVVTVLLLVVAPLFVLYARSGTPDMAVMFWVLVSASLAGVGSPDPPGARRLILALACAGLAASVKFYGGLALIPAGVQIVRLRRPKLLAVGVLASAVTFVLGSPYALLDWPTFRADLQWQWTHMREGHGLTFVGTKPSLVHHWIETLPAATSPLTTVLFGASLAYCLIRWRAERAPLVLFLMAFWVQLARSPLKFARYSLPLLPLQLLLLAWVIDEMRGNTVRRCATVLLGLALVSECILSWGHAKVLTEVDVRDRAGAWLAIHAAAGDRVFLPGRPYFATPPLSGRHFEVIVAPLTVSEVATAAPDWVILTDYDLEPVRRDPAAVPDLRDAVNSLLGSPPGGASRRTVHQFSSAPRPLRVVSWGTGLLPHDMRYHCPTIWIIDTRSPQP